MANAMQQLEAVPGDDFLSDEARRTVDQQRAEKVRHRQALHLQRENILSQKTSHPARRAALEAALDQIEAQIAALG